VLFEQQLVEKLGLFCEPKTREAVTLKTLVISHIVKEKTSIPEPMKPMAMSMLELSLSFDAKTENFISDEIMISSASESRVKEPIFYNFMPIPEIDQVQVSRENVFATKTHDGSEEVSTELKLGYGSCITKKSKLEPSLSFKAKPENSTTDETITSFASERREKEPIFYNFIPIPEVDQYQCSKEYVFATKTHDESEEVSTELKLGYGTCIPQKRKATENLVNLSLSSTALGAKRMKLNSHEGPNGVSLELKLGIDPWVIKKRIKTSDIGDLSRLLLPADLVKKHILPLWNTERIEKIKDGVGVGVWDCDTKSEHQLLFKQWASNGSYVLIGKWTVEFVKRRGLKKDDEIGLYWDQSNSRFSFSILNWALSNRSSL
jgi:hypothetical protein